MIALHGIFTRRPRWSLCTLGVLAVLMGLALTPVASAAETLTAEQLEFFEKKIRPVLAEKCYKCHGTNEKKIKGGLVLTTRELMLIGGDSGPVIELGNPEASPLIESIRYTNEDFQMPPKEKLSAQIVADFEYWITKGRSSLE